MKRLFTSGAILFAIFSILFLILWAFDVLQDRTHTITAKSLTPIFAGPGKESCGAEQQMTTVQAGATFRIHKIRYWKDCATVDVVLDDGRKAHFVLGVGDVSIHPALPKL
jgi:hypothetical protein